MDVHFIIYSRDIAGNHLIDGGLTWAIKVYPDNMGGQAIKIDCEILDHQNGVYSCKFRPVLAGKHTVRVLLNNKHVRGSPFTPCIYEMPDWQCEEVAQFVEQVGFPEYRAAFINQVHQIDSAHNYNTYAQTRERTHAALFVEQVGFPEYRAVFINQEHQIDSAHTITTYIHKRASAYTWLRLWCMRLRAYLEGFPSTVRYQINQDRTVLGKPSRFPQTKPRRVSRVPWKAHTWRVSRVPCGLD